MCLSKLKDCLKSSDCWRSMFVIFVFFVACFVINTFLRTKILFFTLIDLFQNFQNRIFYSTHMVWIFSMLKGVLLSTIAYINFDNCLFGNSTLAQCLISILKKERLVVLHSTCKTIYFLYFR